MMSFPKWIASQLILSGRRLTDAWDRFWFTPTDVAPLAAIRICTGLVMLYVYLAAAPDVLSYIGPGAWVDAATIDQLRQSSPTGEATLPAWWGQSVWFYTSSPATVGLVYVVFLVMTACFTLGLFTRAANVVVWAGHLSFIHRAFLSWCGMDTVLAMLTFYLLFAPSGNAFALDCRRKGKIAPQKSWGANVALRMIQVHMCVIYLCAGLSKLQGPHWWDGTAVWRTMTLYEFAPFDLTWLGYLGDDFCLFFSSGGVLLTLAFEIGFAFLIWNPKARPALLGLAVLLHAGIGFFMGMGAFGAVMLTGCLSFVDAADIRRFVGRLARKSATGSNASRGFAKVSRAA